MKRWQRKKIQKEMKKAARRFVIETMNKQLEVLGMEMQINGTIKQVRQPNFIGLDGLIGEK